MVDVLTPEQRRSSMSHNRGRTKPELSFASILWKKGHRFYTTGGYRKITGKKITGSPDIIFPKKKLLIFIDGCFWHGCKVCKKVRETTNQYWLDKIARNIKRDKEITNALIKNGWNVIRIWEHDIKDSKSITLTISNLETWL